MANNHIHPHGNATREISCMNLMVLRLEARMEGRERERERELEEIRERMGMGRKLSIIREITADRV